MESSALCELVIKGGNFPFGINFYCNDIIQHYVDVMLWPVFKAIIMSEEKNIYRVNYLYISYLNTYFGPYNWW